MSSDDFEERIVEAVRSTRRAGKIDGCTLHLEALNKGCGDKVALYILLEPDGKISDIRYEAKGCMLSRASVSLACDAVIGLEIEKAISCAHILISSVSSAGRKGEGEESGNSRVEDARSLIESVRHIPLRLECALLPWRALVSHSSVGKDSAP